MTNQQIGNFTDEEIRAQAHSIWLARQESGAPGNADTDWKDAVNALSEKYDGRKLWSFPLNYVYGVGIVVLLGIGFTIAALFVF